MISLKTLAEMINPRKTVLFLGSGTSIPSGAPSAGELARYLSDDLARGTQFSEDLMEVSSILENKYGRKALITSLREKFRALTPSGGLLTLPMYDWHAIYTTNYDRLIESAYRRAKKVCIAIRSNYEYSRTDDIHGVVLYKLHGCINRDIVDGVKDRIVVTERDYEEYSSFRQILFKKLELDILTKNVLVVGHSLNDPHIKRYMQKASRIINTQGATGKLLALIYEKDENRAILMEQRGFEVAFGSFDDFLYELANDSVEIEGDDIESDPTAEILSPSLTISAMEVSSTLKLSPNIEKLFHGRPVQYSDIEAGYTFSRSQETDLIDSLSNNGYKYLIIKGVGGVGKTSLARRLMYQMSKAGHECWEHNPQYELRHTEWLQVKNKLKEKGKIGFLLIDACVDYLRQVNLLVDNLAIEDNPNLKIILTANHALWTPRSKSPNFFKYGRFHVLSKLDESEIDELVYLIDRNRSLTSLVDSKYLQLNPDERKNHLRRRCKSDMFVCLKNIFSFDSLDNILLKEYASLPESLQDTYRNVAAIEATGASVHRQLIIRLLGLDATTLSGLIEQMHGLVEEYEKDLRYGIYTWETRHNVIAETIAKYKYADQEEIYNLFDNIISNINPAIKIELWMLRNICSKEYGIGRISDKNRRIVLYQKMINVAPAERIPRHRLISTLLSQNEYLLAEDNIKESIETIGIDPPLHRYKVLAKLIRARDTEGIMKEDRLAILRDAENFARVGIGKFPKDKYAYYVYSDIGFAIADLVGETNCLDDAISSMNSVVDQILDPDFEDRVRNIEQNRRTYS